MRLFMVVLVTALVLLAPASCMDRDDLIKVLLSYFVELHYSVNPAKLIPCMENSLGDAWDRSIKELQAINYADPLSILLGFPAFLKPTLQSIGAVEPCGGQEIATMLMKIREVLRDQTKFAKKLFDKIQDVGADLQKILKDWESGKFDMVGKTSGATMYWLFFTDSS